MFYVGNCSNRYVMAVLAHPDDEALLCFGTLAWFVSLGAKIHVLFLTDGGQGRHVKTANVLNLLSASYTMLNFPVSNLVFVKAIVKSIEEELRSYNPLVLITHNSTSVEHQDHIAVSHAATLAARRNKDIDLILHSEPPMMLESFSPNFYVKINNFL